MDVQSAVSAVGGQRRVLTWLLLLRLSLVLLVLLPAQHAAARPATSRWSTHRSSNYRVDTVFTTN